MKFSENWLRQWVNPEVDTHTLSETLTMIGLEIESVTPMGENLDGVFVGEVLSAEPHPNADRLRICKVRVNEHDEPLDIVCGAANVRAGLKVAVATVGAVLPGNFTIKKAKIRGLESFGMICSSSELALTETSEGIMELPQDAPVGQPFSTYLQLPDHVIDVNITPNRGDCLSIQGMAREIGAALNTPLTYTPRISRSWQGAGEIESRSIYAICEQRDEHATQPELERRWVYPDIPEVPAVIEDTFPINLLAPADCPRYVGRIIRNINPKAQTPLWMSERLRRSGLRCIHPVVDITNYVMLELGQPMHAFDLSLLSGEIQIRQETSGETLTLLDGQTIKLDKPLLVIADKEKVLAMAGIMGGSTSAVTDTTTDIFLESAFFTPETIAPSTRHYPVQSDSSYRFERGVNPQLALIAMHRATALLLEITGGVPGPVIEKHDTKYFPVTPIIHLRHTRIKRILGIDLDNKLVEDILQRLGMQISATTEGWEVAIPSYRFDLRIEVDLIEELARIYGYNQIPNHHVSAPLVMLPCPESILAQKRLRHFMIDHGYHESINYSFVHPEHNQLLNPAHNNIALSNPISADMSVMRTSLWPGLIQAALFNLNRQQSQLRLFEIGACFFKKNDHATQSTMIAGIALGPTTSEQWGSTKQSMDFFDLKGDIEALLSLTKDPQAFTFSENTHPALHPGRAANLYKNKKLIGHLGALHPSLQQQFDLHSPAYLFEIELSELEETQLPAYQTVSKYPSIRRDLAFVVEKKLPYQKIRDIIVTSAGNTLKNLQLFDVYEGKGINEHQKSMALGLTFQSNSRTLTDLEIDEAVTHVVNALKQDVKATLRE